MGSMLRGDQSLPLCERGHQNEVIDLSTAAAVDVQPVGNGDDEERSLLPNVKLNDLCLGERLGARRDGGEDFQVQLV